MTRKAKPATVGEKIVMRWHNLTDPKWVRCSPSHSEKAKSIDSAIKRAVKEAFVTGREYESSFNPNATEADSMYCSKIPRSLNVKYGTKL